jgi:hypothetical protein
MWGGPMAQVTVAELLDQIAANLRAREPDINRRRAAVGLPPISLDPDKVEFRRTESLPDEGDTPSSRQRAERTRRGRKTKGAVEGVKEKLGLGTSPEVETDEDEDEFEYVSETVRPERSATPPVTSATSPPTPAAEGPAPPSRAAGAAAPAPVSGFWQWLRRELNSDRRSAIVEVRSIIELLLPYLTAKEASDLYVWLGERVPRRQNVTDPARSSEPQE